MDDSVKTLHHAVWSHLTTGDTVNSGGRLDIEKCREAKGVLMQAVRWLDAAIVTEANRVNHTTSAAELLREVDPE